LASPGKQKMGHRPIFLTSKEKPQNGAPRFAPDPTRIMVVEPVEPTSAQLPIPLCW
jgi:hypothetical protein